MRSAAHKLKGGKPAQSISHGTKRKVTKGKHKIKLKQKRLSSKHPVKWNPVGTLQFMVGGFVERCFLAWSESDRVIRYSECNKNEADELM